MSKKQITEEIKTIENLLKQDNINVSSGTPIIEAKGVSLFYSKDFKSMDNCNFVVHKGDFHILIGNNGAGKSTTMSAITGLNLNYTGDVLINQKNLKLDQSSKKGLSYILEKTTFPLGETVYEYLYSIARLVRNDEENIESDIDFWLHYYQINELKNKKANKTSSGQKRKILLVRAAVEKPSLLILDEPVANLDPDSRNRLFKMLKKLNKDGTTILLSTHILKEVEEYANSVTLIERGKIMFNGKTEKKGFKKIYNQIFNNYEFN